MSSSNGQIINVAAYAQGKMLDHSQWAGRLPRSITPSDIDFVLADGRFFLFVELSSRHDHWNELAVGQRRLFEDLILRDGERTVAVLARHNAGGQERQIDTLNDVVSFEVLFGASAGRLGVYFSDESGEWARFVLAWFEPARRDSMFGFLRQHYARSVVGVPSQRTFFDSEYQQDMQVKRDGGV